MKYHSTMKGLISLLLFCSLCILEAKMEVILNSAEEDILKIVPDEKLMELRDFFKVDWPKHVKMYNFIDTAIRMKAKDTNFKNYINIYSPNGDWSDGTIVGIVQMVRNDLVLYSFDKTFSRLKDALKKTKIINWDESIMFPALKNETVQIFKDFKKETPRPFVDEFHADSWRFPKEMAAKITWSIPKDHYLAPVNTSHIDTIYSKKQRSQVYTKEFTLKTLETSGGIGLFSKKNHELHGWILKNYLGVMTGLEVVPNFRRKGLGSTMVKVFAKKLSEEGLDAIAHCEPKNKIAQHIFEKLGFKKGDSLVWLYDTIDEASASFDLGNRKSLGFY